MVFSSNTADAVARVTIYSLPPVQGDAIDGMGAHETLLHYRVIRNYLSAYQAQKSAKSSGMILWPHVQMIELIS